MAIRNGRFQSAKTIITDRADTYFRILNSGEFDNTNIDRNAFNVIFGPGAGNSVKVLPTFSLDFFARTDVAITAAGAGTIQGMYEALPNPEFKSGRFKTKDPMIATAGVPIITSGVGNARAIYRIFNSGSRALQLFTQNPDGTGASDIGAPINADESLDFVTLNNKVILVKGAGAGTDHIEGIYDFIQKL